MGRICLFKLYGDLAHVSAGSVGHRFRLVENLLEKRTPLYVVGRDTFGFLHYGPSYGSVGLSSSSCVQTNHNAIFTIVLCLNDKHGWLAVRSVVGLPCFCRIGMLSQRY
jgi:hypothetical protein